MAVQTEDKKEAWALHEQLLLAVEVQEAGQHPANLLKHMTCFDEREGESFRFNMEDPQARWGWQRDSLDLAYENKRTIFLKARQIGVTWIFCGFGVWNALYAPGTRSLFYRQRHEDAIDLVRRSWYQLKSLPPHLWNGARIATPSRGERPTDRIELRFPDGEVSTIMGMTSSTSSGHGYTGRFVLLDEFARIDNAEEIVKAISAVAGDGWVVIVSTANGVSNPSTGAGNQFHFLWVNTHHNKLEKEFLGVFQHPDRDEDWYHTSPEVLMLKPHERAEQYPRNEFEAFTYSMAHYFDGTAMSWYSDDANEALADPLLRMYFKRMKPNVAQRVETDAGNIAVFVRPKSEGRYCIGADTASGEGLDFSAAYVVDLDTMEICAEYHGREPSDIFAEQLHYLGKWYNDAWLAVENQGGWGTPVIDQLRMGYDGRPYYPALYRHRPPLRIRRDLDSKYGMPMGQRDRPKVLEQFAQAVRERAIPRLPRDLRHEMTTFVRHDPNRLSARGPWPRAQEGCNDDRILAAAIAFELYAQRGEHPLRQRREAVSEWEPRFLGSNV